MAYNQLTVSYDPTTGTIKNNPAPTAFPSQTPIAKATPTGIVPIQNTKVISSNVGATNTTPTTTTPLPDSGQDFVNSLLNSGSTSDTNVPNTLSTINNPQTTTPKTGNTVNKEPSAADKAFETYLASLQPDAGVTSAETAYNDYIANQSKSVAGLEGQGRGIPLQLVRGEQAKLLAQTQPEAQRLQNAISIAQTGQAQKQNASKATLDFVQAREKAQADAAQQNFENTKPVSIASGANAYQLNPATGKYEQITQDTTGNTVSPEVLQGMLNAFLASGTTPSFGMGASALRQQFYAALGGADSTIASDAATNKAVRAGLTTAYKTQTNQYAANQTAINTLDKQLELAQEYSDQVSRSGSPLVNKYLIGLRTGVFGDPDTAALNNIVKTASYEFAKILSGAAASISGVTVNSQADAENLLNSAMTKGQFNEVIGLMKKEAQFRLQSQADTIKGLENDLSNIGNPNPTSPTDTSQSTGNSDLDEIQRLLDLSKGGSVPNNAQPTSTQYRTDRNNNPIAAAMKTGSKGNEFTQALDKAGIKWTQGDAFKDNPSMSSIKILGNAVEGARAILANSGSIQNWYINHTGKTVLPQYGITNNKQFAQASKAVQDKIIKAIYKAEVGSGILTNGFA